MAQFRIEKDSMGEMKIPAQALYGASTQRAKENFPISGLRFSPVFIRCLGHLKWACARVNQDLNRLESSLAQPILEACHKIAEGQYFEHFVVDIFQTGSGTSTNMNFNEVVANLANQALGAPLGTKKPVHPNDHVNMGQSSNDVIPSTIHLALVLEVERKLLSALESFQEALNRKEKEFDSVIKVGRTHLQDATPLTLGQVFSGYKTQVRKGVLRLKEALEALRFLPIGGTAVGTGINTHPEFGKRVCQYLSQRLETSFYEADNHFEAQATKDSVQFMAASLEVLASSLLKIANDIRFLSSGPRAGLAEIVLPAIQPGSSIMPGKVNPVLCESLMQVCVYTLGSCYMVGEANRLGSNFELNVMMPLMAHALLTSVEYLVGVIQVFQKKCLEGIKVNKKRVEELLERSLMLATALAPHIGYDKAAEIAKEAFVQDKTIREVALEKGVLDESKLKEVLDPKNMINH